MRQLVSVVHADSIGYFLSDGDDAQQIAQLINPGLEVPDVIRLGVNLVDALALNGVSTNGIAEIDVPSTPALPAPKVSKTTSAPKRLKPHELKQRQRVLCPEGCAHDFKRTSLSRHLEQVHGWAHTRATRAEHDAPAIDGEVIATARPRGTSGGRSASAASPAVAPDRHATDGRRIVERRDVTEDWPNATPSGVYDFIRSHPQGVSTREIALAITADTPRGRQTIGNKLQTLRSQGLIRTFDGERPHFKTGKPSPTMIVIAQAVLDEARASVALDGDTRS